MKRAISPVPSFSSTVVRTCCVKHSIPATPTWPVGVAVFLLLTKRNLAFPGTGAMVNVPSKKGRAMETFEGHISMTTPMVTPHLPALLVQVLLEQGLSASDLLEGTGTTLENFSQPQHLFSYQQLATVIARGLQLTGNPRLGFEFGKRVRHSHMAELGVALSCVPDMETGYQIMRRYQKILGSAFNIRRVDHPGYVALIANKLIPLGGNYHFNQESWLVSLAYNLSPRPGGARAGPGVVGQFTLYSPTPHT